MALTAEQLKALQSGNYYDPVTNWTYGGFGNPSGGGGESGYDNGGGLTAIDHYLGAENVPWYQGQQGYGYDLNGNQISQFDMSDPSKVDWGERIAIGMIAAMTGGAALSALGGAGAVGGAGGAAGGGAGGAAGGAAGVGEAGWGMGLDSVTGGSGAFGVGGGAGAAGPGMAGWGMDLGGAGEFTGAAPGWTSAAADSQLANLGLEAGGSVNPLAGYSGTGGVTGSPLDGGGSFWDSLKSKGLDALTSKGLGGLAATALGGLAGAQGQQGSVSVDKRLDPRLDAAVYGDLLPRTTGLLSQQMAPGYMQGYDDMRRVGQGLLNAPVAGNGFGKVTLNAPTTPTNPYLAGQADDISRRTKDLLDGSFMGIQGNSVASGGLGGSRQGVAQGIAMKGAADSLQGNLANLYGTAYTGDQTRALQQYGLDQSFYGQQRGQDQAGATLGGNLYGAGTAGMWGPLNSANDIYKPYTGLGSATENSTKGGGWQGALGGAIGGAQLYNQWFK